jgi:predicted membrane metal-binding protein
VSREVLAVDAAVAVVLAALILIISPGLAVTAIIALLALAVCGLTLVWSAWRRRRGSPPRRRRARPRPR